MYCCHFMDVVGAVVIVVVADVVVVVAVLVLPFCGYWEYSHVGGKISHWIFNSSLLII